MDMDDAAQVKTLAHELGHVLLHAPRDNVISTDLAADATLHRGIAEVEAESIALMVGAAHGLDTSSYTVPYVSTWAASVPGKTPVEVVQSTAERVRTTALGILEQARHPEGRRRQPARSRSRGTQPPSWRGACHHRHASRRIGHRAMKVPVVLTTVRFDVGTDGRLRVSVDGQPYASDRSLSRDDLRSVLNEITANLGTAVRVEVHEADGTTYSDIETPAENAAPEAAEPEPETATPALAGAGFRPGEQVALAYVVARQEADANGNAAITLPPALLAATRQGLVLLGLTSLTVAPVEAQA